MSLRSAGPLNNLQPNMEENGSEANSGAILLREKV